MEIKIRKLSLKLGEQQVLKNINATWTNEKVVGLVGHNGSGKTVLMRCLSGMIKNFEGMIKIDGKYVGVDYDFPPDMGLLIETPGFIERFSAYSNLICLAKLNRKIDKDEVRDILDIVGLGDTGRKPVGHFSLGMRQRLGIAQAIMESPSLLILDEPFNGLDKEGVEQIHQLLQEEKEKGTMMILSSHHAEDIDRLCDEVYEMENGEMRSREDC